MLNNFAAELLKELNSARTMPLYHDSSLNLLFEQITQNSEFQVLEMQLKKAPCINSEDILSVIQDHSKDVKFLSDHIMKIQANDFIQRISRLKGRPSEETKFKFRIMFNKLMSDPTIQLKHLTHCYIHLYENSSFYLILIVLSQKFVIVDAVTQMNTCLQIKGWLDYPRGLSGIQIVDGDQYYELDDHETMQQQVRVENRDFWIFDLFIGNSSTSILPLISQTHGRAPVMQFFCEKQIGEIELKEMKSLLPSSNPIKLQLLSLPSREPLQPVRANLKNKINQIKSQKQQGFSIECQPKVPQSDLKNIQLFRIEENQFEQSSAKHNDLDNYTKNLEMKYLNAEKNQPKCVIDGLISSESQMMEKSGNSYVPLTHKEQPTLSDIRFQTLNTQDSAINEHLNMLDPKQLENIYQDLCKEMENPVNTQNNQANVQNNLQQSQQVFQAQPSYSVESQYFGNSQQIFNTTQQQQQPIWNNQWNQQQPQIFQQQQPQPQQFQQYQIYPQQQQLFNYAQYQDQYVGQQQLLQMQQMQQQYQMMLYHQQLQQYPKNLQINQQEEQFHFDDPSQSSPPKKWSFSPEKQSLDQKKRASNPEQTKNSIRYSIRQSVRLQKKSELFCPPKKIMEKEGIEVKENEIQFKCKLKINSIHPYDFTDLKSNRAQKKIQEIETGLHRQSLKIYSEHSFNALYRNEKFADVTLIINGHSYRSHKSVLIQASPYFRQLLLTNQTEIVMKVEDLGAFDYVFKYIYLGKLSESEWKEIGISLSIPLYRIAQKLQLILLIETLISKVVIPMMTAEFVLDWYIICFRNTNRQIQYILKYVYVYTVTFFTLHGVQILGKLRKQNNMDQSDGLLNQEIIAKYKDLFKKMTSEELYFLIQQPLMQTDQEGLDNLLWILTQKKELSHIDLLNQLSLDHALKWGFAYKDFSSYEIEKYLPTLKNQIIIFQAKLQETKKRRSSIYADQEFQYSESLLEEYSFQQNNKGACSLNKMVYEMKISDYKGHLIVSECFSSQSFAWRLLIEVFESTISIYIQERGPVKNNLKFMNLEDLELDESLPQYTKLNFISILLKIVVCSNDNQSDERFLYHTFPTNQYHSVGFQNLQHHTSNLHIKVYIEEDPMHSALMNWCGYNISDDILKLPYFTLYSLLKSDMLKISEEKQLLNLFYKIKETQDDIDLLILPIRFFLIPLGDIFSLSRDCELIRKNKLFQKGKNHNQKPRKHYQKIENQIGKTQLKEQWLQWLVKSDHKMKINIEELQQDLKSVQKKKEQVQPTTYNYQIYHFTPQSKTKKDQITSESPKCSIF